MTTLILKLPVGLAKRLAAASDHIGHDHHDTAIEAIRLFTRSVAAEMAQGTRRERLRTRKVGRRG